MSGWRVLLIVYREIDVKLPSRWGRKRRFNQVASDNEVIDAVASFRAFPELAAQLSFGAAKVDAKIVEVNSSVRSLSSQGNGNYWPSPDDTRQELDRLAPSGSYESIFVFWPQNDSRKGTSIPCRGWGLGMGASDWSNDATYAVVGNAPPWAWQREAPGEVWLHEWLHGVCHQFATKGYAMPARDADGAELHGYKRSPVAGWTEYYSHLMSGKVLEKGIPVGIPLDAWKKSFV